MLRIISDNDVRGHVGRLMEFCQSLPGPKYGRSWIAFFVPSKILTWLTTHPTW